MPNEIALLECPLCSFSVVPSDDYVLQLHFEQEHTEDSPFRIENDTEPLPTPGPTGPSSTGPKHGERDTPSESEDEKNVLCPEPDCGELVLLSDFNDHLDLHAAETLSFDEISGKYHSRQPSSMQASNNTTNNKGTSKEPSLLQQNFNTMTTGGPRRTEDDSRKLKKKAPRGRGNSTGSEKSTLSRSIAAFNPFSRQNKSVKSPNNTARLGRTELGPHAWEDRMPKWLHDQLANGPKISIVNRIGRDGRLIKQEQVQNETPGIIPILAQLSALDRSVKQAYYCHPSTLHVGKTPKEGGFCGYRNIQMLISYIQGAHAQGQEEFPGRTPGILKLQDLIERAWDKGINEIGRQQTGGIRDTRKYIGTPEAQALFLSSQIDCAVELFTDSPDGQIEAHEQLLYAIESYFSQAAVKDDGSNVIKTLLPPIYLQQPGHSITIIGFERRKDGASNLVVFDPMYHTSPAMHALIGRKNIKTHRPEVLQAYRRGARQLGKHAAFEALMLTAFPPLFPAWDVLRQFPDCRYVYAFFRSKTLGYDVYPEDHFLRNFPWQQYGGLWIIDDARFARAEKVNPLTAQALRRITGEGASPPATIYTSSSGSFGSDSLNHSISQLSSNIQGMRSSTSRVPSLVSSMDGSLGGPALMPESSTMQPVLSMLGMHTFQNRSGFRNGLPAMAVEVPKYPGKRYPGYPSPDSPSPTAKQLYPTPNSDAGDRIITSQPMSPMSIDGSEMCGPSRRCISHGYERYGIPQASRCDSAYSSNPARTTTGAHQDVEYVAQARCGGVSIASPPRSVAGPTLSPTNAGRPISPRHAMLKNMVGKQALQNISHNPSLFPPNGASGVTSTPPHFRDQPTSQAFASPPNIFDGAGAALHAGTVQSPHAHAPAHGLQGPQQPTFPPSIEIANGIETSCVSPISPSGTMLRYTSYRPVDSGLLALRPLSEAQVAEYRFWRPCGRRVCAFGCGGSNEGEMYAAKRLFRDVEPVVEDRDEEEDSLSEGNGVGGDAPWE